MRLGRSCAYIIGLATFPRHGILRAVFYVSRPRPMQCTAQATPTPPTTLDSLLTTSSLLRQAASVRTASCGGQSRCPHGKRGDSVSRWNVSNLSLLILLLLTTRHWAATTREPWWRVIGVEMCLAVDSHCSPFSTSLLRLTSIPRSPTEIAESPTRRLRIRTGTAAFQAGSFSMRVSAGRDDSPLPRQDDHYPAGTDTTGPFTQSSRGLLDCASRGLGDCGVLPRPIHRDRWMTSTSAAGYQHDGETDFCQD